MEALQYLIDTLTDLCIDLEGEDECIVAGFRFELEDIKSSNFQEKEILIAIKEFEQSWIMDIEDLVVRKNIVEVLTTFKRIVF